MAKATSLLVLPPPPSKVNAESISAAYRLPLSATVSALKSLPTSTELQIALPCPTLHSRVGRPRSELWSDAQHLLANVYSLFCAVCAKLGVDVDMGTPGSVDARVLLLDYNGQRALVDDESTSGSGAAGPIVDLPTFAMTRNKWDLIFAVDGEEGQKLLASYTVLANKIRPPLSGHVYPVGGGVTMNQASAQETPARLESSVSHKVVAVGGTFDHLHAGHKLLLTATALLLQPGDKSSGDPLRLIIGITGDELLKNKKYAEYLADWKQRQDDVVDFLKSVLSFTRRGHEDEVEVKMFDDPVPNGRGIHTTLRSCSVTIECVEIQDPFGPTVTDESVTALIVSGETRSGGQAVNDKRAEKGWNSLEVFEVDVLDAGDAESDQSKTGGFESKISSSAIRKRIAETTRKSSL